MAKAGSSAESSLMKAPGWPRSLWSFGFVSGVGLILDLGVFAVLVTIEVPVLVANVVSAACAVTVVYMLATRYTFGTDASWRSYAMFVAWYVGSILLVSIAIHFASSWSETAPIIWKLISVPLTFTMNFLFSRWLFRAGGAPR